MVIDIINDSINDLVFVRWGTSKTFKVIGCTIFFGAIGALIGSIAFPNDPETNNYILKEKEIINHESK